MVGNSAMAVAALLAPRCPLAYSHKEDWAGHGLTFLPVYFGVPALKPSTAGDRSRAGSSSCIRLEPILPWPLILPNSSCTSLSEI